MKIISWNVNGLRAVAKKGKFEQLFELLPDIICLQEVKAHPEDLPEEVKNVAGYFSYFDHSKIKKGYSGVAVYTKIKPEKVEYGMGIEEFDLEGRLLEVHFKDFILFNVYFPNGGGGSERLDYKMRFYDAFLQHIEKLKNNPTSQGSAGHKSIIFCGDVNTAHEEIDLARPKENEDNTGFLPEERAWLDEVVNHGYVDVWRNLHQNVKNRYTYWDMKTGARDRNVGWRIDYFFISSDLQNKVVDAKIHENFFGSDHCPIELEVK